MRRLLAIFSLCFAALSLRAETIPPSPDRYFNDYANVVPASTALQFNEQLADFERQSSDQILVAIYPKMQSDSEVADYATRVFRSWKVGQRDKNNGAVLFVFIQDHKWFLETGYGLEGALPDALVKTMMDEDLVPRLRAGDYTGAFSTSIRDIIAAAKGEYKGTGRTVRDARNSSRNNSKNTLIAVIIIFFILSRFLFASRRRGWVMGSGGWGGWGGGGGGFSGFSGGGGSSGGGGAGGSW